MNPAIKTPYIFAEARSQIEGAGFVLHTNSPFEIAIILTFKDNDAYLASMGNTLWPTVTVTGYRILLQFAGSLLKGRVIEVQEGTHAPVMILLKNMADFFQKEKIDLHTGYYKKFLITPDSINQKK